MVVAPKTVRPGLPYAVSVNILKSDETDHIVRLVLANLETNFIVRPKFRVEIRTNQNDTVAAKVVNNVKTGKLCICILLSIII